LYLAKDEKMLPCHKAQARLGRYHDGELPPDDSRELRAHLDICEACRRELESVDALDAVLENVPVSPVPGDLVQNVMRAARAQEADRDLIPVFDRFWRGWTVLMRFAAVGSAAVACYIGLVAGVGSAPSPRPAVEGAEWLAASSAGPIVAAHMGGTR
jgi:anti-sigma factor RsiW